MQSFNANIWKVVLLLLFVPFLIYADWADPIEIYVGGETADVAVDRNSGNAHIVSYKTTGGLVYTKTDPDGKVLTQESIAGAEMDGGGFKFSGTIAIDNLGYPHLTYRIYIKDNRYDGYYVYRTQNGWSNPLKLFTNVERANQMRMAIDDNNRVHIVYPKHIEEGWGKITYLQIYNGSIMLSYPDMTGLYEHRVEDHIEIDASRSGEVYFVLGNPVIAKELMCFRSLDAGTTWQPGFDIRGAAANSNSAASGSPDVFIGEERNVVHFAYGCDRDSETGYKYSLRYARWVDGVVQRDVAVTTAAELEAWKLNLGIGSVAASDEGKYVLVVYSKKDGGQLRYRFSQDYGATFGYPSEISATAGGYDGRDKAKVRSYFKRFYAVYTRSSTVYLRIFSVPGFNPPVANAGGPYSGTEGTAITFNASGSSDDVGIAKYEWDWNNDGTYDATVTTATTAYSFPNDYSGVIKLRVTDNTGLKSVDDATVTVANANPVPSLGGNITGLEGTPINFALTVTDPGINDTHTYSWNFGDGGTETQKNPSHTYTDNGSYQVTVIVRDNNNGTGQTSVTATVANVAPTAEAGGPYSGSVQQTITLTGSGSDPAGANDPLTYAWDTNNDGVYDINGQTAAANFATSGTHTVKLKVSDGDGGDGFDTATVNVGAAGPVISNFNNQITNEGTAFPTINLDTVVEDLDTPDNQLIWEYSGQDSLIVSINASRQLIVTVPRSEWAGTENITFRVRDPQNHEDQKTVAFTVNPVNDPPVLNNFSDQYFPEDSEIIISRSNLVALVTDPDSPSSSFVFSITNNTNVLWNWDANTPGLRLHGRANWSGNERVTLKVEDGAGGSGTREFTVYITAQPDPPATFTLVSPLNEVYTVWPASIQFKWNSTTDPDQGDQVTYQWALSRSETFSSVIAQSAALATNSYTYNNSGSKVPGIYYWRVEARGSDGLSVNSTNYGVLNLNSKAPAIAFIPNQTTNEGSNFPDLALDNYVTDGDNAKSELSWRYEGAINLVVQISQSRVVSVRPPNNKWFGTETITFIVTDPTSLSDSAAVLFTVRDVNAKPVLQQIPNQTFDEDGSKVLARALLESWAADEDNAKSEFSYKLVANTNILYTLTAGKDLVLSANPNWSGQETVALVVEDGSGAADSAYFKVTVNSIPDPPAAFDLLSPKDNTLFVWTWPMKFTWQEAEDPDAGDVISYYWQLSRSTNFEIDNPDILDAQVLYNQTTSYFNYMAPKSMEKGAYYWKLTAFDGYGNITECNGGYAMFSTMMRDVEMFPNSDIPKEFTLYQNHPNPFNPETRIQFALPKSAHVKLTIFNSLGQRVRELVNEERDRGVFVARWDARDENQSPVSTGIYIYQLIAGENILYRKMLFIQ
jgi:PKD repeat protein